MKFTLYDSLKSSTLTCKKRTCHYGSETMRGKKMFSKLKSISRCVFNIFKSLENEFSFSFPCRGAYKTLLLHPCTLYKYNVRIRITSTWMHSHISKESEAKQSTVFSSHDGTWHVISAQIATNVKSHFILNVFVLFFVHSFTSSLLRIRMRPWKHFCGNYISFCKDATHKSRHR